MARTHEEIVFASDVLRVGRFRAAPGAPSFHGGHTSAHLIVFPRTTVQITHAGSAPVVADPTRVMFYNRDQEYRRDAISPRGDLCEWFALAPAAIVEAHAAFDPRVRDRQDRPFLHPSGPSDPTTYLLQRALYAHVTGPPPHDAMFVEEAALTILRRAVANLHAARAPEPRARARARAARAHAEIVGRVKAHLASRFHDHLTLTDLAAIAGCSPFHLCRAFRSATGLTVHRYVHELRLHAALERIVDGCADLTRLAYELGYSSHSHFTKAFRERFQLPPSRARRLREAPRAVLRKIVTA